MSIQDDWLAGFMACWMNRLCRGFQPSNYPEIHQSVGLFAPDSWPTNK
jgi:hypothetical protein